jgi:hypothetical protein
MPAGHELMLRITTRTFDTLCARHNVTSDGTVEQNELAAGTLTDLYRTALNDIQLALIRGHVAADAAWGPHGRIIADTAAGRREFRLLNLTFDYNTIEVGHTEPNIGISLSSRYKPTLLDWAYEYGGSDAPISLDGATVALLNDAHQQISGTIPEFADATPAVVAVWY